MDRILAFDLGTKSLGVAITDSLLISAHGYENFRFQDRTYKIALKEALRIIDKENIREICIGLPLHMSGEMSDSAQSSLIFRDDLLKERPHLKIEMIDERMTTMIANKRLLEADLSRAKRKRVIDEMSAVVILESYLSKRSAQHGR